MRENQVVMTAGDLRKLKVWTEVCRRNRWNVESMERMISDDMRFHVDADLLGSVTNFIVVKEGMYLQSFDENPEKCVWTELEEEALVFANLDARAIQKSFRNHGHGAVVGLVV